VGIGAAFQEDSKLACQPVSISACQHFNTWIDRQKSMHKDAKIFAFPGVLCAFASNLDFVQKRATRRDRPYENPNIKPRFKADRLRR
jgi:hypothetical protein